MAQPIGRPFGAWALKPGTVSTKDILIYCDLREAACCKSENNQTLASSSLCIPLG